MREPRVNARLDPKKSEIFHVKNIFSEKLVRQIHLCRFQKKHFRSDWIALKSWNRRFLKIFSHPEKNLFSEKAQTYIFGFAMKIYAPRHLPVIFSSRDLLTAWNLGHRLPWRFARSAVRIFPWDRHEGEWYCELTLAVLLLIDKFTVKL